jgi:integration host factor subunit beta
MTKSELIDRLSSRLEDFTRKDTEVAVNELLDYIGGQLAAGKRVEIRGFGSFDTKERPSRTGRNPKTGESVFVPAKQVPFFRAGKAMRERVDRGE